MHKQLLSASLCLVFFGSVFVPLSLLCAWKPSKNFNFQAPFHGGRGHIALSFLECNNYYRNLNLDLLLLQLNLVCQWCFLTSWYHILFSSTSKLSLPPMNFKCRRLSFPAVFWYTTVKQPHTAKENSAYRSICSFPLWPEASSALCSFWLVFDWFSHLRLSSSARFVPSVPKSFYHLWFSGSAAFYSCSYSSTIMRVPESRRTQHFKFLLTCHGCFLSFACSIELLRLVVDDFDPNMAPSSWYIYHSILSISPSQPSTS